MKKITANIFIMAIGGSMLFTSCYKKFDEDSYKPALDIAGFSNSREISPSNLVGFWAFNGGLTDSVSGTAGTATGTGFTTGFKNKGLQGSLNSYVLTTPSSAVANLKSFTIAMWVNSTAPTTGIIGLFSLAKTDGFWGNMEIFFENGSTNANGKFRAHIQNGAADAFVSIDNIVNLFDKWTHLALTYDGAGNFKLYVNGNLQGSSTVAGWTGVNFVNVGKIVFGTAQFMTTPSQTTGSGAQSWASYLTGVLDEVRIYNKPLPASEIGALVLLEGRGK